MDLFNYMNEKNAVKSAPLAERMKPKTVEEFIGQEHIFSKGKLLRRMVEVDQIQSIILYGPPGTGKTSISKVIANTTNSEFVVLNAVTSGVKDIREVIKNAEDLKGMYLKKTILFVDEIHRFNKSQQDALLPYVENGTVTLIGATTENPFFEVNSALISRSTVFALNKLSAKNIKDILIQAINDSENGLGMYNISITEEGLDFLADMANGDARKALNSIELGILTTNADKNNIVVLTNDILKECCQKKNMNYDKNGDYHYDIISAFIKSMRGSDPDATLHYLARMIYSGEDVKFIARRIIIAASEDVGLADSNALIVAKNAADAVHMIGMPEARIILSHAALYVALAPKSNSAYTAIKLALMDVENGNIGEVPYHLRDGTSNKMKRNANMISKDEKFEYLYPHNYEKGYVKQQYLPEKLVNKIYFNHTNNGDDKK